MYTSVTLISALLAAFAAAAPQSPSQISAAGDAIAAYESGLLTDSNFLSAIMVLETDSAGLASFTSLAAEFATATDVTGVPTSLLNALPTEVQPVIKSVVSVEQSILLANGISGGSAATTTDSGSGSTTTSGTGAGVTTTTSSKSGSTTASTTGSKTSSSASGTGSSVSKAAGARETAAVKAVGVVAVGVLGAMALL